MSFVTGLFIGFFLCFFTSRYADKTMRDAGDAAKGVCDNCTAHCVGYHCRIYRDQEQAEV